MKTTKNSNDSERNNSNTVRSNRMQNVKKDQSTPRNGKENTSMGKDQEWQDVEGTNEEWENLSQENSFGTGREFGMAVDNKKRHESESKSVHIEDWENDPYTYQNDEDDVRGEFKVRGGRTTGKSGRGNEHMDESQRWHDSSGTTDEHSRGNEHRESGQGKRKTK
jgi:hypothetical protein